MTQLYLLKVSKLTFKSQSVAINFLQKFYGIKEYRERSNKVTVAVAISSAVVINIKVLKTGESSACLLQE